MQTLKVLKEAESYDGPSIVIAYSPCIAHGIDMMKTQVVQKRAVECGYWPLYKYNPSQEKPFVWENPEITGNYTEFIKSENRYKSLIKKLGEENANAIFEKAHKDAQRRMEAFKSLGEMQNM